MFFRNPVQTDINIHQAKPLHDKKNVLWLDVREVMEFNNVHIPGSTLIPMGQLANRETELSKHKDKDIIVYCRTGHRSGFVTRWLNERGYNAKNLAGGIMQWSMYRYPVQHGRPS